MIFRFMRFPDPPGTDKRVFQPGKDFWDVLESVISAPSTVCIGNPVIRESLQEIEMCFENFANFFWTKKSTRKNQKFSMIFFKFISRSRRIDLNWFQSVSRKINPPIPRGCKKFEKIYGYTSHLRSDFDRSQI